MGRPHSLLTGDNDGKAQRKESTRAEKGLEGKGRKEIDCEERTERPGSKDGYERHHRSAPSVIAVKKQPAKKKVVQKTVAKKEVARERQPKTPAQPQQPAHVPADFPKDHNPFVYS